MTAALNRPFSGGWETCLHFQLGLDTCISSMGLPAFYFITSFSFTSCLSNSSSLPHNTTSRKEFGSGIFLIISLTKICSFSHFFMQDLIFLLCCPAPLLHSSPSISAALWCMALVRQFWPDPASQYWRKTCFYFAWGEVITEGVSFREIKEKGKG